MLSFVVLILLFIIAVAISMAIINKPGGSDIGQRKVVFWVLAILTPIISFLINYYKSTGIEIPTDQADYQLQSAIAAGVVLVVFILAGLGISKASPKSKLGSWFN